MPSDQETLDSPPTHDLAVGRRYQLRITLDGIEPEIWRTIEVPASITLPDLHDALQVVMGWEDYHLHKFVLGDNPWDSNAVSFVEQTELDESYFDDVGRERLAEGVRIEEILIEPGDEVLYVYDYGDGWLHHIALVEVRKDPDQSVVCLEGVRACPPEDCGGEFGYTELLRVLDDPEDAEYEHLSAWAGTFEAEHFDVIAVNAQLDHSARRKAILATAAAASPLVGALLSRVHPISVPLLIEALDAAHLSEAVEIDDTDAAVALAKIIWLIDHIGDKLKLTPAGYLPPTSVAQMRHELDWAAWPFIGGNREVDHFQATLLRESMIKFGLIRKIKGELLPTARATKLRSEPRKLWEHVASRMPRGNDDAERDAGVVALIATAAGIDDADPIILETMPALGWQANHPRAFTYAAATSRRFLFLLGAPSSTERAKLPVPPWIPLFAREVLRRDNRV
ncbi:plasmid pRiA4b ORF-3 family protein [Nocardia sp. 348MFTsu5.1]|uniref:plasmid pRiA4b ORF-3 family protein n=1 Tax=Nocardia sp. 348MFTsu5.1 TaxID=1172185 RepID=UPI00036DD0D3|nr:plasmid pRiA4b ORF-3 family protein [Nocardia sp. 348MFTsu5.1]